MEGWKSGDDNKVLNEISSYGLGFVSRILFRYDHESNGCCMKFVRVIHRTQSIKPLSLSQIGSDVAQGEVILPAGQHIGAAEVGILAGSGAVKVRVYARPVVAVLSTGDEVCEPSTLSLQPGQVRDANRSMLAAAAKEAGSSVLDLGIVPDEEAETNAAFDRAFREDADVLLITGGVSMGQRDYVKPLLEQAGTVHFGKVLMKPGKPLTFATVPRDG